MPPDGCDQPVHVRLVIVDMRRHPHASEPGGDMDLGLGQRRHQAGGHAAPERQADDVRRPEARVRHGHPVAEGLHLLADSLSQAVGNLDVIVLLIGLVSAVVDNVPIVAAAMGMYDLTTYPTDNQLWQFLAYCAGTGGSILLIGSAAGVAVMGMEKLEFGWYLRKISWLALLGYLAGAGVYLGLMALLG